MRARHTIVLSLVKQAAQLMQQPAREQLGRRAQPERGPPAAPEHRAECQEAERLAEPQALQAALRVARQVVRLAARRAVHQEALVVRLEVARAARSTEATAASSRGGLNRPVSFFERQPRYTSSERDRAQSPATRLCPVTGTRDCLAWPKKLSKPYLPTGM